MFYQGFPDRTGKGRFTVFRNDNAVITELDPESSQKLYYHSPNGFSWGYNGSGPAQLALALLFDVTEDPEVALVFYQDFKRDVVAGWSSDKEWRMEVSKIKEWLSKRSVERFTKGGEKVNTMVIRGCGTAKQMFSALKQLSEEFGHLNLKEIKDGNKCRFLPIMRR